MGDTRTDADVLLEWMGFFHNESLLVSRLREKLDDAQIAHVLRVLEGICTECWDAEAGCQCSNDE